MLWVFGAQEFMQGVWVTGCQVYLPLYVFSVLWVFNVYGLVSGGGLMGLGLVFCWGGWEGGRGVGFALLGSWDLGFRFEVLLVIYTSTCGDSAAIVWHVCLARSCPL